MIFKDYKKRLTTSFFLFLLIYLIIKFDAILVYSLIVLGTVSIIEFLQIANKIVKKKLFLIFINFSFIFYIAVFCITFFIFSSFLQLKMILYTLLLSCAASDIGGYIAGKLFKGPKLTKISPNKTVSGSLGSLIFTIMTFTILIFYFTKNFNFTIIIIAIMTSIFCQIGDLFFSFLKRKAAIKDTGNFFPGHGGVLDRIDGILLGIPIGYITLVILL
jgi:phosphatidate cytidylyltransferase